MKLKLCLLAVLAGFLAMPCVEAAPKNTTPGRGEAPIFYPPAPDKPRLQFLKSFSTSADFEKPPSAFRLFITGREKKQKSIVKPYGVAVHDKRIYVCDTVHNGIDILDFNTRKFEHFAPQNEAQLGEPINLDFDAAGTMYVADARRGQIVMFDKDLDYLGVIGKGSEFKPTGVLIKNDKIFVCDLKNHSIRVFRLDTKEYLMSIPRKDAKPEARLFSPANIAVDSEGNLYVSDLGGFRVQKYNVDGEYLMTIGSHGDAMGQFARPKGITVDNHGNIYVVDAAFGNVQLFDKSGRLLLFFGDPGGSQASLVLPAGIAIDYTLKDYFAPLVSPNFEIEYLLLVTSQYGDRKLNVYGFGHEK